jgi:hypothetical protein
MFCHLEMDFNCESLARWKGIMGRDGRMGTSFDGGEKFIRRFYGMRSCA